MMALGDEMKQILSVAHSLSGLQADDFAALRQIAAEAQPWAEELEAQIRDLLAAHEATRPYVDTYLNGQPAAWFRSLFEVHDVQAFLHAQMNLAVEHVRHGVPNEVVLALAPRWVEWMTTKAAQTLGYEKAQEIAVVMTRVLNLAAVVMVATYDMVIRRTFIRETGFSEALLKRLQTRTLQEIADEMKQEQQDAEAAAA